LNIDALQISLRRGSDPERLPGLGCREGILEQAFPAEKLAFESASKAALKVGFHFDCAIAGDHRAGFRDDLLAGLLKGDLYNAEVWFF
jgi:hypothetical protein